MTAHGWISDRMSDAADGILGYFSFDLNDDFAATASFAWLGEYPPMIIETIIGLSYKPADHIWPRLVGSRHSELRVGIEDVDDLEQGVVELWEPSETERAAEQLVTPVLGAATIWARQRASVDGLLAALKSSNDEMVNLADIPVVLGAAGRTTEAKEAMRRALSIYPSEADEAYWKDFLEKFNAWIDSGT